MSARRDASASAAGARAGSAASAGGEVRRPAGGPSVVGAGGVPSDRRESVGTTAEGCSEAASHFHRRKDRGNAGRAGPSDGPGGANAGGEGAGDDDGAAAAPEDARPGGGAVVDVGEAVGVRRGGRGVLRQVRREGAVRARGGR